jgi:hypothetical protein
VLQTRSDVQKFFEANLAIYMCLCVLCDHVSVLILVVYYLASYLSIVFDLIDICLLVPYSLFAVELLFFSFVILCFEVTPNSGL